MKSLSIQNAGFLSRLKPTVILYDTITHDVSGSRTYSATSPATISMTIGSNSNRILIVWVLRGNTTTNSSGVTWNGVSLTKYGHITSSVGGVNHVHELWYLIAPSTGSSTVSISFTDGSVNAVASSIYNVNQVSTFGTLQSEGSFSNASSRTISVTTNQDKSWVVSVAGLTYGGGVSTTASTGVTGLANSNAGNGYSNANGFQSALTANSYNNTYSFSGSSGTIQSILAVEMKANET